MIVAGLGFRRGVTAEEIEAAIALALDRLALSCGVMDEMRNMTDRPPSHGSLLRNAPPSNCDRRRSVSTDAGRSLSHRERVGVRGSGLSIGHTPSPYPSPHGRGNRRGQLLHSTGFREEDVKDPGKKMALAALATLAGKAREPGLCEAARWLGLPIIPCSREAMGQVADRIVTFSARAEAAVGLPSVAEAAALVAAGASSRLLVPRVATAAATCAIAEGDAP